MSLKKLLLLKSILVLCIMAQAQQPSYVITTNFAASGVGSSNNLIGNGAAFHKLTWNVSGTVSACTIALDSSTDGNSWNAGGVIAGQTCTSNGTITSSSSIVNFVRLNMTSFTGTGTVFVIDQGYVTNPVSGSPTTYTYLASPMSPQTSATCTDITGMSWPLLANKQYKLQCTIGITGATSSTLQYCLNGPGTATGYSVGSVNHGATVTSGDTLNQTSWQTKTATINFGATTGLSYVNANISNGATASGTNLSLQTAANGTNSITVLADSACTLIQTN